MKKKGDIIIVNHTTLSCGGDFMDKDDIKEKCDCNSKAVCFEILRLLQAGHRVEATDLIRDINGGKQKK